jgi:hypothetical protein
MTGFRLATPLQIAALAFALSGLAGTVRGQETNAPTPTDSASRRGESGPFHIGVDVVSRYLWRGKEYSGVANFQPHAGVDWKNFEFGTWGSYSVTWDYQEQDLYLMYSRYNPKAGTFVAILNDYFYPSDGGQFAKPFNYAGVHDGVGTGAHTLELMALYTVPKVPLKFSFGWNFYNDPDHARYGEVAVNPSYRGFEFGASAGWALNTSAYYFANQGDLVNLSASIKRSINLRPPYSFYVAAYLVRNPILKETHPVFMICIRVCGT